MLINLFAAKKKKKEKKRKVFHFELRILLTGKKYPKVKLQRLRKIRLWTFGSLTHQINSF